MSTVAPQRPGRHAKLPPRRGRPLRPGVEDLEARLVMDGSPVVFGDDINNQIQINLSSSGAQWTIQNGIYKTNTPVTIGLKPHSASFTPVLILGNELDGDGQFGIMIDPSNNKFTIHATQTDHNVLSYQPNGNAGKLAALFEFVGDIQITSNALLSAAGIAPSALVLATDPQSPIGIKLDNGGVLSPSTLQMTRGTDLNQTTQIVMTGPMDVEASSKANIGNKLLQKLHVTISNDANANVTADAAGNVRLVSQTGSALLLQITEGAPVTLGPIQILPKNAQMIVDLTAKTWSISGQFTAALKDDGPDTTPFLLDFGDTNRPGIVMDFSDGFTVDEVYVAVQAGTNPNGQPRSTLNMAGLQVSVNNLFILYDRTADVVGFGGQVTVTIGEASDPAAGSAQATLKLGSVTQDPATSRAGLFFKNGAVDSFAGELSGTIKFRRVVTVFDVTANYTATSKGPDGGNDGGPVATIFGTLKLLVNNPLNQQTFAVQAQVKQSAPIQYKNGDWVIGGLTFQVQGDIDMPGGLDLVPKSLMLGFADVPDQNNPQLIHRVFTISGSVSLPKFWNATIGFNDGANAGLTITDGDIQLDGFQFSIDRATIGGGVGLRALSVNFQRLNNGADWDLKVAGKIVLPGGFELDASLELKDGLPVELGVEYKATGTDPGIPVGDTGLFVIDAGLQLDNLYSSEIVVEGEIGLGYGEPVDGVHIFEARGHFKVDRHEFDIVQAEFEFLGGNAGKGTGSLNLNWTTHEYKAAFDVEFFYQVFDISGNFTLNPFGQITVLLDVGLRIPTWVPFVGGDRLLDIEGLFYYDPVVPANTLAAGWIDINTFVFGHWRAGLVYYPNAGGNKLRFVTGGDVENLENLATQDNDGYTTTYTASISTNANLSTVSLTSDTANIVGNVSITVPGLAAPVTLAGGATTPVSFSVGNLNYLAGWVTASSSPAPPTSDSKNKYVFVISADPASNKYAYLPQGSYTITTITAEALESTLSHTESFAPPQVTGVSLAQPTNSNTVSVTVAYGTGDPGSTSIDLMYTTDPLATSGTKFQTVSLTGMSNTGNAAGTFDLSPLAVRKDYYVLARIYDTSNPGGSTLISTAYVTPYPTISAQLTISPNVPFDRSADTLSGWPVTWTRTDVPGSPTIQARTDSFGYAGLAFKEGTYTVTIAPTNWDGFSPTPGANQTATDNGETTQTGVAAGVPGSPTLVSFAYANMISVHGQISEDLSGNGSYIPGGAGLAKLTVYSDLDGDGTLDPGEPRTMTDLGGYYDLRFPLPATTTSYTIRLLDDGRTATYLRVAPTDPTNLTFKLAAPGTSDFYAIPVNPLNPDPGEEGFAYNGRDFLVHHPIVIAGVGYVTGTIGKYGPAALPAMGQKIDLFNLDDNSTFLTTNTGADGSYSFQVPKPGRWRVSTDDNDFATVSAPGRHEFAAQLFNGTPNFNVPATTPGGQPLYQLGTDVVGPLVANGDFFQSGLSDVATLAVDAADWSATKAANLYVVVYKGADLPSKITSQVFLVASNLPKNPDVIPSLYWSDALLSFVLPTPKAQNGTIALNLFPITSVVDTVSIAQNAVVPAAGAAPSATMTTLLGLATSTTNETQTWLMTSDSGREWMLLQYSDLDADPQVLAAFNFFTANGVRPDLGRHSETGGVVAGRWSAFTTGEFDGDGVPDYVFNSVDGSGAQVVSYLLSKENYGAVHTLQLGGAFAVAPNAPNAEAVFINSISALPLSTNTAPGAVDNLAIHRSAVIGTGPNAVQINDMLIFNPIVTSDAQLAAGGRTQSVSFAFLANFPLQGGYSDDVVTDVNADSYPDLLILDDGVLGAIVARTDGTYDPPVYSTLGAGLKPGASGGLIAAGTFPAPVPCDCLPSFLFVEQEAGGPLSLQFVFNASNFTNSYIFNVESSSVLGGFNFGFVQPSGTPAATFSGSVYVDANSNGRQDPGEPSLPNRTVKVVTYGAFGPNEPTFIKTGPDGRFSIPDTSQPLEISVPGFNPRVTDPATNGGMYDVVHPGGVTGYDFGVSYGVVSTGVVQGLVYQASNPDGSFTPGDPGIANVVVFLDVNGTGKLDPGDKQATTDSFGVYRITGLPAGTYVVLQVLPSGVSQLKGPSNVVVAAGQTTYAVNFGDSKSTIVNDYDLDGRPDYLRLVDVAPGRRRIELDLMATGGVGRSIVVGEYDPTERRLVGQGDVDHDGRLDLIFQEPAGGDVRYWALRDGAFREDRPLTTLPAGLRAVGAVDVDRDGSVDLLVRDHDTGELTARLLRGTHVIGIRPLGSLDAEQVIAGYGDIDGDRATDLLIRNAGTGEIVARPLATSLIARDVVIGQGPAGAELVGVEPGVNGTSRLYWRDDLTGGISSWLVDKKGARIGGAEQAALARSTAPGRYFTAREADTPLLPVLADRAVVRGEELSFDAGRNAAAGARPLVYALDPGAPAGATIDAATGRFAWTPAADLPPGDYHVTIRATDASDPGATDARSFVVHVTVRSAAPFVRELFTTVLGRPPSAGESAAFAGRIEAGTPLATVVQIVLTSPEARGVRVDALYRTYLHRTPTGRERARGVAQLLAKGGEEALVLSLLTSREYARTTPTARSFVASLYHDVLGRTPSRAEANHWLGRGGRRAIAKAVLHSREARSRMVDQAFSTVLGRPASSIERDGWVSALGGGSTRVDLFRSLLSSDEFFNKAGPPRP